MSPPTLPPRRFLPQPIETTSKTHGKRASPAVEPEDISDVAKRKPQPIEASSKINRKGAVDEDSTKKKDSPPPQAREKITHRFAPVPVESSTKSNRKANAEDSTPVVSELHSSHKPARRFAPEPVETSIKSNRRKGNEDAASVLADHQSSQTPLRKFAPEMIETTRRSRKSGDSGPAVHAMDRTDSSHEDDDRLLQRARRHVPSAVIPGRSDSHHAPVSKFSSHELERKASRKHSFRVPDLAPISSECEESEPPSLSTSASGESDKTELHKHANKTRESCDDRFSGYLLDLASKTAEKQMREQAMAAFPNEGAHEPVNHFAIEQESDTSDDEEEGTGQLSSDADNISHASRRESAAGWDMAEMRQYKEKLQQLQQRKSGHEAARRASMNRMRHAASPPMLGENLRFPKCESPRQTRLDVDQYYGQRKRSSSPQPPKNNGLWTPQDRSRGISLGGLWMGLFLQDKNASLAIPHQEQTGLLTPAWERNDPFSKPSGSPIITLPPSPPNSQQDLSLKHIDKVLEEEREIDREFPDEFITQIYNYLSLGYPALARKYDEELCKISRISLENLRKDDSSRNAKGYIGAPEGIGLGSKDVREGYCGRWSALRLYVREWARQQPKMRDRDNGNDNWGARARRGSWAV